MDNDYENGDYDGMDDQWEKEEEFSDLDTRRVDFARSIVPEEVANDEVLYGNVEVKKESSDHFIPFHPNCDVTQQRSGFQIADNVSYYNLGALMVLFYANISEGVPVPVVFEKTL